MNILDKTNKSIAPVPGTNGVLKREKFQWPPLDKPGEFKLIPKIDLNIEGLYQRDPTSEERIRQIAANFSWFCFNVLTVVQRVDGTYWVVDGGHRTRASFHRDDITSLPCWVFRMDSVKEEAEAFRKINMVRSSVNAFYMHRSAVIVEDPIAQKVEMIVAKHGLVVSKDNGPGKFRSLDTITKLVKQDCVLAERCFDLAARISHGSIHSDVLNGLFHCAKDLTPKYDILSGELVARLETAGAEAILAEIKRQRFKIGSGAAYIHAKLGVLETLNKFAPKRARKLKLD